MRFLTRKMFILLASLQTTSCAAEPPAEQQAIDESLNSERLNAVNAMLNNGMESVHVVEYIDTLTTKAVESLTPFIKEFLSVQGEKVDEGELRKKLFDENYVRSLLKELTDCKNNGLKILKRLSAELPELCRDQNSRKSLENRAVFVKFHNVVSDPDNGIDSLDAIANKSIDESAMKKLVLALMQDFHKLVTSDSGIISRKSDQKRPLEEEIASLKQSITMMCWILGGFGILIAVELVILFFHREKFN